MQECNVWDFHRSIRWAKCFVDVAFSDELTQLLMALVKMPDRPRLQHNCRQ